jgi:hypothetical protein
LFCQSVSSFHLFRLVRNRPSNLLLSSVFHSSLSIKLASFHSLCSSSSMFFKPRFVNTSNFKHIVMHSYLCRLISLSLSLSRFAYLLIQFKRSIADLICFKPIAFFCMMTLPLSASFLFLFTLLPLSLSLSLSLSLFLSLFLLSSIPRT